MIDFSSYFPITDSTWIFFIVLLIILFAPMIMSKLRIPHIIGMVLAGVIVGQYGLNILQRDGSFELFGQVGLYYIMFLAGLEMDLEGIKKRMKVLQFAFNPDEENDYLRSAYFPDAFHSCVFCGNLFDELLEGNHAAAMLHHGFEHLDCLPDCL